ncbi:hypothetical protein [Hyphomonas sp.]|uniref:hypothetical protein n=1 Tax=Hyphomonas sp. TaxID=87 RepID=UPI003919E21C
MSRRTFTVPCTIRIRHTFESLEAHVELDGGIEPGIGDRVIVHGAPVSVPFGQGLTLRREATVTRANFIERAFTRLHAMFLLTELYEVSFSDGRV